MSNWDRFRKSVDREIRREEVMAEEAAAKKAPKGRGRPPGGGAKKKSGMAIYKLPDAEKFGKELLEMLKKYRVELE